jgi:hypothetical protein
VGGVAFDYALGANTASVAIFDAAGRSLLAAWSRGQHWLPTALRAASVMACSSRQEQ